MKLVISEPLMRIEVFTWLGDHGAAQHGSFDIEVKHFSSILGNDQRINHHTMGWVEFEDPEVAMLFKLTWLG